MKTKHRDELLIKLNRAFRDGGDYKRRYALYVIGEGLILEYEDSDYKVVSQRIERLEMK